MVFVPHAQRVAHDARAAEQGKQDAFFAGVGAMPIHAQAECEKQADGNPQHLVRLLLIAVERVGFAEHDVELPQRGEGEQRDGDEDKQGGKVSGDGKPNPKCGVLRPLGRMV